MASNSKAVTGTAVMARSANEKKKKKKIMVSLNSLQLMFFQLIARSSSKLTLPSCALSSPTAQFLGNSALFLRRRLAINDESQQGGHAGFTILATCLARACLQIFTGDREQTRAGTGGHLLRESLLQRLAHKGIGFLDGPPPSSLLIFFALCCLGKIPRGAPFSQLHKSGNGSRVDRP